MAGHIGGKIGRLCLKRPRRSKMPRQEKVPSGADIWWEDKCTSEH